MSESAKENYAVASLFGRFIGMILDGIIVGAIPFILFAALGFGSDGKFVSQLPMIALSVTNEYGPSVDEVTGDNGQTYQRKMWGREVKEFFLFPRYYFRIQYTSEAGEVSEEICTATAKYHEDSDRWDFECNDVYNSADYSMILLFLYWIYFEASKWRASLGKRVFGTQVYRIQDGKLTKLGWGRSIARNLLKFPALVLFFVLFFNKNRRGLHDLICKTVVVQADSVIDNDRV